MSGDETRIRVSEQNWRRINAARAPNDTMDDALSRLLDKANGDAQKAD